MLRPKALTKVLVQPNSGGIQCTLLVNRDGVMLAYSGWGESDACVTAAIAGSLWASYEKHGKDSLHDDQLNVILVDCEKGRMGVARAANLLVCMCADETVPMGMLRAKIKAVAEYLHVPLSQFSA